MPSLILNCFMKNRKTPTRHCELLGHSVSHHSANTYLLELPCYRHCRIPAKGMEVFHRTHAVLLRNSTNIPCFPNGMCNWAIFLSLVFLLSVSKPRVCKKKHFIKQCIIILSLKIKQYSLGGSSLSAFTELV